MERDFASVWRPGCQVACEPGPQVGKAGLVQGLQLVLPGEEIVPAEGGGGGGQAWLRRIQWEGQFKIPQSKRSQPPGRMTAFAASHYPASHLCWQMWSQ